MLTSLSDSLELEATLAGGTAPDSLVVRQVGERRWLHDHSVVEVRGEPRRWVVANAPGSAELEVSASLGPWTAQPDTVVVTVEPRTVAVRNVETGGEWALGGTLHVRGWRVSELDPDDFLPLLVEPITADSATAGFRIRGWARSCEEGGTLSALGPAELHPDVTLPRGAPGLRLEVGERLRIPGENRCLLLEQPRAWYVLSYAESSYIRRTLKAGHEPAPYLPDRWEEFFLSVRKPGAGDGSRSSPFSRLGATPHATIPMGGEGPQATARRPGTRMGGAFASDGCWRDFTDDWDRAALCPEDPLEVGDVLPPGYGFTQETDSIDILHVGNRLVYGVARSFRSGVAPDGDVEWIRELDSLYEAHALPILSAAFPTVDRPATTWRTGQFLVIFYGEGYGDYSGITAPDGQRGWVTLGTRTSIPSYFSVLVHEMGHAFDDAYLTPVAERDPAVADALASGWASEGVPSFLAQQALRSAAGIDFAGNLQARRPADPSSTFRSLYLWSAFRPVGDLLAGYNHSVHFFRDLVWRSMQAGLSWEEAMAQVSQGAGEGFWGPGGGEGKLGLRPGGGEGELGLTPRMRRVLGSGWTPVEGLLLWSLSAGMDDFTDAPELQDPGFDRMREAWLPIFEVDPWRKHGGSSLRGVGSTGYGLLRTWDRPLPVTLEALDYDPDRPREQWGPAEVAYLVARYR